MRPFLVAASIGAATVAVTAQRAEPDVSTRSVVGAAAAYVRDYQAQLRFVVADETYIQEAVRMPGGRQRREMTGELFLAYIPGDTEWIAVHDVAFVDGAPVTDREALRTLLQQGEVSRVAQLVANRNAAFNIGTIRRNFNEPTLPLLLLGPKRVNGVDFDRRKVERLGDTARVTLAFTDRGRPTLIRTPRGGQIRSTGELVIDAASGRVERTALRIDHDNIEAGQSTVYTLDDKINLWVPSVFREQYLGQDKGVKEMIVCEARYTNYRRFEVTGRIK
jgi:hypothetical protein